MIEAPVFNTDYVHKLRHSSRRPASFTGRGGHLEHYINIEDSQKLKSSLERKVGYGYNVLGEVDILLSAIQSNDSIDLDPEAWGYVLENELTAACEAVDSGRFLWSNFRQWDSEKGGFLAFGMPFLKMLQAGVEDIEKTNNSSPSKEYTFELERRQAEVATEKWITDSYAKRQLRNGIVFNLSPYPEEAPEEIAASLGYKPKERLGKMRFEVFVNNVRQTVELSVAKGSVKIFQRLLEKMGFDSSDFVNSTSFLRNPVSIENSANYLDVITTAAEQYDSVLEEEDNGSFYFCGQKVGSLHEKNYKEIVDRQRWVREKGRKLVESICELDLELARSLNAGMPTSSVLESLNYWRFATDNTGAKLLNNKELSALSEVLISGHMTRGAASVLKKNDLVRMWSIMACVLNEDKAQQMFGKKYVQMIQGMVENTTINTLQSRKLIDQMIADINPVFLACGGSLSSFGGQKIGYGNLFQSSLSSAREILFGGSDQYGSLEFECPKCSGTNRRPKGKLIPNCQRCNASVKC